MKKIPLPTQTLLIVLLSISGALFNTSPLWGKCTASTANGTVKIKPCTVKSVHFGQKRLISSRYQVLSSVSEFERLMTQRDKPLTTVVIDPGHGGKDDGTKAPDGTKEKDIALAIAGRLGDYINHHYPEVEIIFTRQSDKFIPLNTRARIANESNADLFISVHCNSFTKAYVRGTETYVMGAHRADENLAIIRRENGDPAEEGYSKLMSDNNPTLNAKELTAYQQAQMKKSLSFATKVENEFGKSGRKSRGVQEAGFLVLRRTVMPSVLVETGYLSNEKEMKYLRSRDGQEQVAYNIYSAFAAYKKDIDKAFGPYKQRYIPLPPLKGSDIPQVVNQPKIIRPTKITFGVQLLVSMDEVSMKSRKWKSVRKRVQVEKSADERVRYVLKDYGKNYKKAQREFKKLKKKGFDKAFVTAYDSEGKVMAVFMAKKQLGIK